MSAGRLLDAAARVATEGHPYVFRVGAAGLPPYVEEGVRWGRLALFIGQRDRLYLLHPGGLTHVPPTSTAARLMQARFPTHHLTLEA